MQSIASNEPFFDEPARWAGPPLRPRNGIDKTAIEANRRPKSKRLLIEVPGRARLHISRRRRPRRWIRPRRWFIYFSSHWSDAAIDWGGGRSIAMNDGDPHRIGRSYLYKIDERLMEKRRSVQNYYLVIPRWPHSSTTTTNSECLSGGGGIAFHQTFFFFSSKTRESIDRRSRRKQERKNIFQCASKFGTHNRNRIVNRKKNSETHYYPGQSRRNCRLRSSTTPSSNAGRRRWCGLAWLINMADGQLGDEGRKLDGKCFHPVIAAPRVRPSAMRCFPIEHRRGETLPGGGPSIDSQFNFPSSGNNTKKKKRKLKEPFNVSCVHRRERRVESFHRGRVSILRPRIDEV